MKKSLVVLILLLLDLPIITAQNPTDNPKFGQNISDAKEKISTTIDTIGEIKSGSLDLSSLEETWTLYFYKTNIGKKILILNPITKVIIGMEITLSRLFILTLFLWMTLLIILYRLLIIPKIYINKFPRLIEGLALLILFSWI